MISPKSLALTLSKSTYHELNRAADKEGVSMSQVISIAVTEKLARLEMNDSHLYNEMGDEAGQTAHTTLN